MKSIELYNHLERDFISKELRDDWARYMGDLEEYLTINFKERSMGLVCDFANEINKVYSAVFPTDEIMQSIIDDGITDALLFIHHPSIWDIRRTKPFYQMNKALPLWKVNQYMRICRFIILYLNGMRNILLFIYSGRRSEI
jgi:hypothetical protein